MPIHMRKDVQRCFQFSDHFFVGDTPAYFPPDKPPVLFRQLRGSYLDVIRPKIAVQNWNDFHASNQWTIINAERDIAKAISKKFDMDASLNDAFNDLWVFMSDARMYEGSQDSTIKSDLQDSYRFAAMLAAGKTVDKQTFSRSVTRTDSKFVIFSDFHMTAFKKLPNYFKDFNYQLYLDVLPYYADEDYTLVENGDVEDCVLFEPDNDGAHDRLKSAPLTPPDLQNPQPAHIVYPVRLDDGRWDKFLHIRYSKRRDLQQAIFNMFSSYYELIRNRFISKGKYVRLIGNHDTYLDEYREKDLRDAAQEQLGGGVLVHDYLLIMRDNQIRYLVIHGHQFDKDCMQHGGVPYAKSLGEIFTECAGWANQGADRVWRENDTKRWYIGDTYSNELARATAAPYPRDATANLVFDDLLSIQSDAQSFFETLMKCQIAWEYFENADAFQAFALEVWTGDEMYKLRHLDEITLCKRYLKHFQDEAGKDAPVPKLVIGHTHEPRQNAIWRDDKGVHTAGWFLNSGSAGRYQNLIWGIEIEGNTDRIVSWSRIDGVLTRIPWKSQGDTLVHDV
ncbi:MAG: hypothetical protein C5B46_04470 [Proteobacteria bacterium]|nr:MAG: hypothetical protein C5B46_04470 [Pseudomonadota bacterium]